MNHAVKGCTKLWICAVAFVVAHRLDGQVAHVTPDLLTQVRRAAALIPGDPPTEVRYVVLNPFRFPVSNMVEGQRSDTADAGYPVFQLRFPRGWIVVDAALDRSFVPNSSTFSDDTYQQIHQALRGASLVVVTHEHHDHVAGVLASPFLAEVQAHTLLTKAQIGSLMSRPNHPKIKIDSSTASRYTVIDYEPIMPVAPGVVLIKAPGHTPGSQLVFVRLGSGAELIVAGDVAWHMAGIEGELQKPEARTQSFGGEDRVAIAAELRWLHQLGDRGPTVLVSHDLARLRALTAQGRLVSGFDLRNR